MRQRVAVHYHLVPLTEEDLKKYILHRIDAVRKDGVEMRCVFDEEVFALIYQYSRGIPRMVNVLCDHALLTAYLKESWHVTREIIEESIVDIRFQGEKSYEQVQPSY